MLMLIVLVGSAILQSLGLKDDFLKANRFKASMVTEEMKGLAVSRLVSKIENHAEKRGPGQKKRARKQAEGKFGLERPQGIFKS